MLKSRNSKAEQEKIKVIGLSGFTLSIFTPEGSNREAAGGGKKPKRDEAGRAAT